MKRTFWMLLLWLSCVWPVFAQEQASPFEITAADLKAVAADAATVQLPVVALVLMLFSLMSLVLFGLSKHQRKVTGSTFVGFALVAALSWLMLPSPSVTLSNPFTSKPDAEEARLLLQALLRNTYNAFTFRDESDVYDMLALSVTGEQLVDIYLQNRESLRIEEAEGRTMTINDVRIIGSVEKVERRREGLLIHAQWYVAGSVSHWDHVHSRLNTYEAVVTLSKEDNSYKISDIEILEEKRTL